MTTPADPYTSATGIDEIVDVTEIADANDLRDTGAEVDDYGVRTELPLEADPADVADQDAAVPYDESER